jgi:hypothetical protein
LEASSHLRSNKRAQFVRQQSGRVTTMTDFIFFFARQLRACDIHCAHKKIRVVSKSTNAFG